MTCRKCGAQESTGNPYEQFQGTGLRRGWDHARRYCRGGTGCQVDPPRDVGPEHLDVRCARCGYTDALPCADARVA